MVSATNKNRLKKRPKYQSFKLSNKIKPTSFKPLPTSWNLWKDSFKFIRLHFKKVSLFLLIYIALYIIFVRGLGSAIDFVGVKENLAESGESVNGLIQGLIFFGVLVTASGATSSDGAAVYQSIIFIVGSLAFIWLIRALNDKNNKNLRIRDSFYQGMHPLVPFLIVIVILALASIPLSVSAFLLTLALDTIAVTLIETSFFVILAALVAMISLYLLSGSWAAIYIVTLSGAEPWKSIKASNNLISVRRWHVMRRLLALVFLLFFSAAILIIPLLTVLPDGYEFIAEYGFLLYVSTGFLVAQIYLYKLYKSLL